MLALTGYLAFTHQHKCNLLNINGLNINSLGTKFLTQPFHSFKYFCAVLCGIGPTVFSLQSVLLKPEDPLEEISRKEGDRFRVSCGQ